MTVPQTCKILRIYQETSDLFRYLCCTPCRFSL